MKKLLKWFGLILLLLLILIAIVLGVAYFLLGTERGFQLASEQASQRVEGLELGATKGNVKDGIVTDKLTFNNDQIALEAKGLDSKWDSACVLKKAACVERIIIDELNIETFDTGEEKPKSTGDIALPDIELPIDFNVDEVRVNTLRFQAPGDAPVQEIKDINLSAYSEGNVLKIDKLAAVYDNISVFANGSVTPSGDYPLDMAIQVDASNIIDDKDASAVITLSNNLNELALDVQLSGAVDAQISGQVEPLKENLPAQLKLNINETGWPLEDYNIAKANNIQLSIDGDINDYTLKLQSLVAGEQIPDSAISLNATANTERALINALNVKTLGGSINADAAVSWQDGTTFVSNWSLNDINPAIKYEGADGLLNGKLIANGELIDGKTTFDLPLADINGTFRGLPFELKTKLEKFADDSFDIKEFVLNNGRNRINAAGSVSEQLDLAADIDLPDLVNLVPELKGELKAKLNVQGELSNPDAILSASTESLQYNDVSVSALRLKANIQEGGLQQSDLTLSIKEVLSGEQAINNTKLELSGTRAAHELNLFADGPQKTSVDLLAKGGLSDTFDWSGSLSKVKLEVPAHDINLRDETPLDWNNDLKKFSIGAHCWLIQESNLCLENEVLAEADGQAVVSLDAYRLEQLNPFLPADSTLGGLLSTNIIVDWGKAFAGGYAASLKADVNGGAINVLDESGQSINFAYETLSLNTQADAEMVESSLTIDSKTMGQANLQLTLDPVAEEKPITGTVDLSGFKLDFLKAFLPNFDVIEGSVGAKGKLTGEMLDPLFNGDIVVSSLALKSEDLPLSVDSGSITTSITGKRARINGALQSGAGEVKVSGKANWLNDTWRADVNINSKQLKIVQEPLTDSLINTALKISARPDRIRVRGNIEVPRADINIKDLPSGAATLSDDIIIVEDVYAETLKNRGKKEQSSELDVAIFVTLGDDVNLTGYGLDASLTGKMQVTLKSPNPVQLGGEITVVKGTFKQYGQDLQISDGQILFVGPIDQTSLNIDAVRVIEEEDRVAGLHIDGRIENPEITLFTEPADKAQESILSYIVLGRDLREASDQEANLLAQAALALTLRGGNAISDTVADKLGIQEISVDARGRGDTTEVVVSGRINDRLLLRYGRSVFDDSFTLYLRYDLTKKLYLEAAQGAARAVDIFYSFSF